RQPGGGAAIGEEGAGGDPLSGGGAGGSAPGSRGGGPAGGAGAPSPRPRPSPVGGLSRGALVGPGSPGHPGEGGGPKPPAPRLSRARDRQDLHGPEAVPGGRAVPAPLAGA